MTTGPWPAREELDDHWRWRPEWGPERACLYWYLAFGDDLAAVLDRGGLDVVRRTPWLDAVPTRWMHVTLCDVGFADELDRAAVRAVLDAGRPCVGETGRLQLSFGQATSTASAVVLPVGPLEPLRHLQQQLRAATERALGPGHRVVHRHLFWPHLSLGYVNRRAGEGEVAAVLERIGHLAGEVAVDSLVLASVTRQRRHYQWTVVEELPLTPAPVAGER